MTRRDGIVATVVVLVVALAVAAGVYAYHRLDRTKETISLPRTGEAANNPLYLLKLALRADGIKAESRQRLQLPLHPLAPRDTVLLYRDPRSLSQQEAGELLDWVKRGGHLIVRTPVPGRISQATAVPVLDSLGVYLLDIEADCVGLQVPGERLHGEFCNGRRFGINTGADLLEPALAWGNRGHDYVYARYRMGAGAVDVLADMDFMTNRLNSGRGDDALSDAPHIALTRAVLAPNYRAGTVHLIYAPELPSLWWTLIRGSWMAWTPLLLGLLAWLWMRMQRFGPLRDSPPSERRSLLEHIVASGQHTYRYGYGHLLHGAVRAAFLARLRRRDPQAAALEGEAQAALIAERFNVSPADIRTALATPPVNDSAAFRSRIATLIRLRNRL